MYKPQKKVQRNWINWYEG